MTIRFAWFRSLLIWGLVAQSLTWASPVTARSCAWTLHTLESSAARAFDEQTPALTRAERRQQRRERQREKESGQQWEERQDKSGREARNAKHPEADTEKRLPRLEPAPERRRETPPASVRPVGTAVPTERVQLPADGAAMSVSELRLRNRLRVAAYNLLDFGKGEGKSADKLLGLKTQIETNDPDILGMIEVMEPRFLETFANEQLGGKYRAVSLASNDGSRAIGLLVKKDLPIDVEYFSFRNQVLGAGKEGQAAKFTRDAPVALLRLKGESEPFLAVMVIHNKSSFRNHAQSSAKRGLEANGMESILASFQQAFPGLGVVATGDFNWPVEGSPEYSGLLERLRLTNALNQANSPDGSAENWTNLYSKGRPELTKSAVDAVLVSPEVKVLTATIQPYLDPRTQEPAPTPTQPSDMHHNRGLYPSDHLLVSADLDVRALEASRRPAAAPEAERARAVGE